MTFIQTWLTDFIRAYDRRTDAIKEGNLQILSALVEIEERLEEHMATDEQKLQQILNKLSAVEVGIIELKAAQQEIKDNNPALSDEFAAADAILDRVAGELSSSPPEPVPEPTPEPTPESAPAPEPESPSV